MSKDSTGEAANGERGPRLRSVRLKTKADGRRLIGHAVNLLLRGAIGAERGGKIVYAAHVFLRSLEADEQRWAASGSAPSPAETARQIRECMRLADAQVPPPPESE